MHKINMLVLFYLCKMLPFLKDFSLKNYNTFGLQVNAANFVEIKDKSELLEFIQLYQNNFSSVFILGGGSNILFTKDIDGIVIKNSIKGIQTIFEDENKVQLNILSGTIWHDVVLFAVENHYQGIENLALIPGTAGAAPMQNIGAYGTEIKNVLLRVHVIDMQNGEMFVLDNETCNFAYRESIFKHKYKDKYFIYSIDIELKKKNYTLNYEYGDIKKTLEKNGVLEPNISDIANAVIEIRKSKLPNPSELGNAGSFFKNPEISRTEFDLLLQKYPDIPHYIINENIIKIPAGWLIEQAGFKGKVFGNTGNHAKQALVIVNYGNATGSEILAHAKNVIYTIQKEFNILLSPEVNII